MLIIIHMNKDEIKKDIDEIERRIEQLKIEYEKYFLNIIKREPLTLKNQLVQLIKKHATTNFNNVMLSFKYKNLLARFLTYQDYWNRILKLIEEGKNPKDYRLVYEKFIAEAEKNILPSETEMEAEQMSENDDNSLLTLYKRYSELLERKNKKAPTIEAFKKTIDDYQKKIKDKYGESIKIDFDLEDSGNNVKLKGIIKK